MKRKDLKNNKNHSNKRVKFLIAILLIFIFAIAIAGVVILNNDHQSINKTNNINNTKNTSLVTNNTTNGPKQGYSLVTLAGLNFYAPDNYLTNYNKGDYFDAFLGCKDYEKTLNSDDSFESSFINSSYLIFIDPKTKKILEKRDGETFYNYVTVKSSKISIYPNQDYIHNLENLGIFENKYNKNKTIEEKTINGHIYKILKTGKGFFSQDMGENETYVYFEIGDKSIELEFTGVPIDKYLIGSFFDLN
ncbi:hypothetical protein [Methanobrevibacter curvatus]|uniref:Uncharacterized protein n=1 Tax=Methanobrevibacter curvatus TaxID=49547 RepID=A0A162FEX9_9EURY|nr:hypothetical protein [Methanobrevibacter curvatus]KZX12075.1 hypothetical protein MBCUR_11780 [Methanobrevibacter curvatus]